MISERSKAWVLFGLLVLAVIVMLAMGVCNAAYGESLGDSFNFGDIGGSYWTSYDTEPNSSGTGTFLWTQLGANLYGKYKIDNVTATFNPYYIYTYDGKGNTTKTQRGYQANEYFMGTIDDLVTASDMGSRNQQNDIDARGLYLHEFSAISGYNSGDDGLREQGDTNIALKNFKVTYAQGDYREYSNFFGGGGEPTTGFNYNVTWYGDFVPGTVLPGFVAPAMGVSVASVPEPSTFALMAVGACGFAITFWRRKR